MLTYLIDGFNLIHKISLLKHSLSPRNDLIQFIRRNRLAGSGNNRVVIVFDGYDNGETSEREYRILFSDDRTADEVIRDELKKTGNKTQIVVVSDDREVRGFARVEGARTLGTRDFLNVRLKNKLDTDKDISCSEAIEINEELEKIWLEDS
jgi:predicted RNA-binding protein with PIN domain